MTTMTTTTVVDTVHNERLERTQLEELDRIWRPRLLKELSAPAGATVNWPEVTHPLEAFSILFGLRADEYIVRAVNEMYAAESRRVRAIEDRHIAVQWVYAFHDARDRRRNAIKIGGTQLRDPHERISQWARVLSSDTEERAPLVLLYAYPTFSYRLAESVVHSLLSEVRLPLRVNRLSNRALVEYFAIDDFVALSYLIKVVTRHVDYTFYRRHRHVVVGAGISNWVQV